MTGAPDMGALVRGLQTAGDLWHGFDLSWLEAPAWETKDRVHNWRNYIPDTFRTHWAALHPETRLALYVMAQAQASNEEWD